MLNKQTIINISKRRDEPAWLLNWRLDAFARWQKMAEPHWAEIDYDEFDYNSLDYYGESAPVDNSDLESVYRKMNLPESEIRALMGMATDLVIDSRSVNTSYKAELEKLGIVFLPFTEAVQKYPDLIKKYLGTVVPPADNFFACLNAAVFSDGTFVYVPKNTKCPIDLASYFRIEMDKIGQFERTLIIADSGSELSYMEGCSAPRRPNHQLHSGVVEVVALPGATVKYATVQNWYAGEFPPPLAGGGTQSVTGGGFANNKKHDQSLLGAEFVQSKTLETINNITKSHPPAHSAPPPAKGGGNLGGIINFVTKRGHVHDNAKLFWTQVEIGSAMTWKYPGSVLVGTGAQSDFYSLAITRGAQMADTGTKMIHIGDNTTSNIVSLGVAMEYSRQTYRSLISFAPKTKGAKSAQKCDTKIIGDNAIANTYPVIIHGNAENKQSHEARAGAVPADALWYLESAGIAEDTATALIVSGAAAPVLSRLPMEFLVESKQLIQMAMSASD